MNEMVEQVARAIEEQCAGCDPRDFNAFIDAARAAIAAMREPTEAMVIAGCDMPGHLGSLGVTTARWHAMIDAALAEG